MSAEKDNRIAIHALLEAGKSPTEISAQLGVARSTVYMAKRKNSVERKAGSGKKPSLNPDDVKEAIQAEPLKSIRTHAKDMGTLVTTMHRAVHNLGATSLVREERPLLPRGLRTSSRLRRAS